MKKSLEEQRKRSNGPQKERKASFAKVCKAFEKEFGRLLSPMEIEQIDLWLNDFDGQTELIFEGLRKAVMLGKHNFKYIDSILLDWQKNNLKTVEDIHTYESRYRERQAARPVKKKAEVPDKRKDKFKLLYLS